MGNYTELHFGKYYFSWKNEIPGYLAFIFEETDFYSSWNEKENWFSHIGYKTTYKNALGKLERLGYSVNFFSDVYEFFYNDLFEIYKTDFYKDKKKENENLDDEQIETEFWENVNTFPKLSRAEELFSFIDFIKGILKSDYTNPIAIKPYKIKRSNGEIIEFPPTEYQIKKYYSSGNIQLDLNELDRFFSEQPHGYPPWLSLLTTLFGPYYFSYEFPEIATLMFLRIILESIDKKSKITLELSDIIESEDDARTIHQGLEKDLVDKVNLYNKVFKILFTNEEGVRHRYIKNQCKEILASSISTKNRYEKGKLFENLTELLFTSNNYLELRDKNVSTGDEEIDLVVINNINRPFWLSLNSPLVFIECKNWSTSVDTKELRNFEIKLQNHRNLVKLGFFISLNGFTSGVRNELKRMGRDNYHVVLIEKRDIEEYISTELPYFSWLERLVTKIY